MDKVVYLRAAQPSTRIIDVSVQASLGEGADESQAVEQINHTISVPIDDPLQVSSTVLYRHGSRATGDDGVEGWATVMSVLTMPGSRPLIIDDIKIEPKVSPTGHSQSGIS